MKNYENIADFDELSEEEQLIEDLQKEGYKNTIINDFKNRTEIVVYKQAFSTNPQIDMTKVDRSRKWEYDMDNKLKLKDENIIDEDFNKLTQRLERSRRRALDNFLGYAYSNEWKYFVTITFDKDKVDRNNPVVVKRCYKYFKERVQYRFPEVTMLFVPEAHHADGALHFHGLVGRCDLSAYTEIAINQQEYRQEYKNGKKVFMLDDNGEKIKNKYFNTPMRTRYGDQIYNIDNKLFKYGYSTLVELHGNIDKVSSYLSKYMMKNYNSINYGQKSYFKTLNLNSKIKTIDKSIQVDTGEINELIASKRATKLKDTTKMTVYTIEKTAAEIELFDYQSKDYTDFEKFKKKQRRAELKKIKEDKAKAQANFIIEQEKALQYNKEYADAENKLAREIDDAKKQYKKQKRHNMLYNGFAPTNDTELDNIF